MKAENANAFSEILLKTFETSFSVKPFRCGPFTRSSGPVKNPDKLLCVLRFSGGIKGAMALTFPESVAKKVYGALMFEEPKDLGQELFEAFAEILNMIAGNVRASLPKSKIEFSSPEISLNSSYENPDGIEWLHIPMAFKEWGRFNLILAIKES